MQIGHRDPPRATGALPKAITERPSHRRTAPRGSLALLAWLAYVLSGCAASVPSARDSSDAASGPRRGEADDRSGPAAPRMPLEMGVAEATRASGASTLGELQREARRRNPTIDRLEARIAASRARGDQVRSAYYPRLRSDGQYLRLDEDVVFRDPLGNAIIVQDDEAYTQVTALTYNLWDWGQTRLLDEAGSLDTQQERARSRRAMQALDLHVAQVFYSILEAQQDIEVQAASVATLEGALDLARNLQTVGRGTRSDVLVVEVHLERRRFQLRRLRDRLENLREDLRRLLDLPLDSPLELDAPEEGQITAVTENGEPARAGSTLWEELALEHREEFRAFRLAREGLERSRQAVLREYLPRVDLFLRHEYSTTRSAFRDPDFFSGGVSTSWDLFSGFRRRHRSLELEARAAELRAEERELRLRTVGEVRTALRALRRAADGIAVAKQGVSQAEINLATIAERFREGKATGQEVLEAESLVRAESAREVRARFALRLSREVLRFACGLDFDESLPLPDERPEGREEG